MNEETWTKCYSLEQIKKQSPILHFLNDKGILALIFDKDEDLKEFYLYEVDDFDDNDKEVYKLIMWGMGCGDECRHTYFKPYQFYITWSIIKETMTILEKYFKFD